jgi:SAM-dependent methyltransferase
MNDFIIHLKDFEKDKKETQDFWRRISKYFFEDIIHFFRNPLGEFIFRKIIYPKEYKEDLKKIDCFVWNNGGVRIINQYGKLNRTFNLQNKTILIQGCGFGKNLIQLISFKPKKIVCFDLYPYKDEWNYLKKYANKLGVELIFYVDDMKKIDKEYPNYFDLAISDAVFEHVVNLGLFLKRTNNVLKKKGILYAGFGPLWYGPCGDHVDWGGKRFYNHLILSKKDYRKNINRRLKKLDKLDDFALFNESHFSYLKVREYLTTLEREGFNKIKILAKINFRAAFFLFNNKKEMEKLEKHSAPLFDRYCSGLYVWMRKK